MPRFCLLFFLISGLIPGASAAAEPVAAQSASAQPPPAVTVTLGHSIVPLNGPWKFHIGDNPQRANLAFDDSQCEAVDLTPVAGSVDPGQGIQGFVPGWTAKGHPGFSGYAWCRIRVRIAGVDGAMALLAPMNVDDSYQLFINGQPIGSLTNAGDLPPFLNGNELPMQGAVPLGMVLNAEFASIHFQLAPDDRLMLLSDGVAEAQDQQGRLFGFERIRELLSKPVSAAEIASAAQKFGQHDDISILSITRTAVLEEALA